MKKKERRMKTPTIQEKNEDTHHSGRMKRMNENEDTHHSVRKRMNKRMKKKNEDTHHSKRMKTPTIQ